MAPLLSSMLSLLPYHLISWGSLLGMELYQSFIMTKLCYRHLPRPQFTNLNKRVFPVYFSLQLGLILLTTATYPPVSLVSLIQQGHWTEYVPLALNVAMAALNAGVYGPRTMKGMIDKIHQETRDARRVKTEQEQDQDQDQQHDTIVSEAMKLLKRSFSRNHAMAIHLNAIAMLATVWYGFSLASRIQLTA